MILLAVTFWFLLGGERSTQLVGPFASLESCESVRAATDANLSTWGRGYGYTLPCWSAK